MILQQKKIFENHSLNGKCEKLLCARFILELLWLSRMKGADNTVDSIWVQISKHGQIKQDRIVVNKIIFNFNWKKDICNIRICHQALVFFTGQSFVWEERSTQNGEAECTSYSNNPLLWKAKSLSELSQGSIQNHLQGHYTLLSCVN